MMQTMTISVTNTLDGNDTTPYPYILCHSPPTLYMHLAYSYALNEQGIYSALLTPFFHRSISAMFSPIKFHSITSTPTYHTDPALLMHSTVSAYSQDRPYLPYSV